MECKPLFDITTATYRSGTLDLRPMPISAGMRAQELFDDSTADLSFDALSAMARKIVAPCVVGASFPELPEPYPETMDERAAWFLDWFDAVALIEVAALCITGGEDVPGKSAAPES